MPNDIATPGVHHVTAVSRSVRTAVDFYVGTLGLRLVKRTVNFDDPTTQHLYFGDRLGSPGTVFTLFSASGALGAARRGARIARSGFVVGPDALGFWRERLAGADIATADVGPQLHFDDPDGVPLSIEEDPAAPDTADSQQPGVPAERRIRCLDGPLLDVDDIDAAGAFLVETLGFREGTAHDDNLRRFEIGDGGATRRLCLRRAGDEPHRSGLGHIHHVAWRLPDEAAQDELRGRLIAAGLHVTPVLDRQYFRSVYTRIPGGVIFEFATDGPGFTADEAEAELGGSLKLPPRFESRRDEIERALEPLA